MRFSIIIPFYNDSENLQSLMLTLVDYIDDDQVEIIIVDDCSTAENFNTLKLFFTEYFNVKIYKNNCNLGPAQTRMNGVSFSSGNYIFFLDSDDGWVKNKAYIEYQYCIENDVALSGSASTYIKKSDFKNQRVKQIDSNGIVEISFFKSLWSNPYATSSVCVKRDVILKYPFNKDIRYSEDVECWRRILVDYDGVKFKSSAYMFKHPYLSDTGLSSNMVKMSISSTTVLFSLLNNKKIGIHYKFFIVNAVIYSVLKSVFRLVSKTLRR